MFYAVVNAKGSPEKATDWSGIKNFDLLQKIQLSWYQ
jgi:hypothetical protein